MIKLTACHPVPGLEAKTITASNLKWMKGQSIATLDTKTVEGMPACVCVCVCVCVFT